MLFVLFVVECRFQIAGYNWLGLYRIENLRIDMNRMVVHSRVGADGVLHLAVPIGKAEADKEVQVTIDPVPKPTMTQEEWRQFVLSTAGSITDPTFVRHGQGEYERREELP